MAKKLVIGGSEYNVILNAEKLQKKVQKLAKRIAKDYSGNRSLVLLFVINGAMYFGTDISKFLQDFGRSHLVDTVRLKRYSGDNKAQKIKIIAEPCIDFAGKNVLVIEDIVDEGVTLQYLNGYLKKKNPISIEYCVLLTKKDHLPLGFNIKYKILENLGPEWVVGYGMDSNEEYRGLTSIYSRNLK